jgi:hypothetical protein
MPSRPLYQAIAILVDAYQSCKAKGETDPNFAEWSEKHQAAIGDLVRAHMPSGSGFDSGTSIDLQSSTPEKLRFVTAFHHHTESGYAGWTEHMVTVRPSLRHGFEVTVSGRDRDGIKEHVANVFDDALHTVVHDVA